MKNTKKGMSVFLLLVMCSIVFSIYVFADPIGASVTYNFTNPGRTTTPDNRTDPGGTITTLLLNAIQQNAQWKAYVGNISGSLTLDDSSGNTIYNWDLGSGGISGEIFATRTSSVTWSSTNCSNLTTITAEETALNINSTNVDSIRNTFNYTVHPGFIVAGRNIDSNSCNATSTFVSSSRQAQGSASFPLMLLHDESSLIYATLIKQSILGYDGSQLYDFQMIVADDPSSTSNTYYFYAEITS